MSYLGFDIGGSSIKAVLVQDKKIVKSKIENLPDSLEKLLSLLAGLKQELTVGIENEIKGAGFGLAGILDAARQTMLKSPNISYLDGQPVQQLFADLFKPYPVKIEHDVHCFLLAEKAFGLAKNMTNVFFVTLGSGIGGAWLFNGQLYRGFHGSAGEIGHTIVDNQNNLTLEELASNKMIKKILGQDSMAAVKAAQGGDQAAQEAFKQLGFNLGIGLANLINVLDPDAIILGGGVVEAKYFILEAVNEAIERYVVSPAAKKIDIFYSGLGREGGALGAILLFE
jgi:glucokinase